MKKECQTRRDLNKLLTVQHCGEIAFALVLGSISCQKPRTFGLSPDSEEYDFDGVPPSRLVAQSHTTQGNVP
jgi:hypothetical protein